MIYSCPSLLAAETAVDPVDITIEDLQCALCLGELDECSENLIDCFLESAIEDLKEKGVFFEYGIYEGSFDKFDCNEVCFCSKTLKLEDENFTYGIDTWVKDPNRNIIPIEDLELKNGKLNYCGCSCIAVCAGGCSEFTYQLVGGQQTLAKCLRLVIFELVGLYLARREINCLISAPTDTDCTTKTIKSKTRGKYSVTYETLNKTKELLSLYKSGCLDDLSKMSVRCVRSFCTSTAIL